MLATFDHATLRTDAGAVAAGEDLTRLIADSVSIPAGAGRVTWSLKPEARRLALASFPGLATLREALDWNPRPTSDPLQVALDAYIQGTARDTYVQSEDELGWSSLVVSWLATTPLAAELHLPNSDRLQYRLEFVRLLGPLQRMAGPHFRGRHDEMRRMREFLLTKGDDDLAPKPLMLTGFGGSGKTTLLAKLLLDYSAGTLPGGAGPFVFLDFDRPSLEPREPATILLEALRQIAAQSKRHRGEFPAADLGIFALEAAVRYWSFLQVRSAPRVARAAAAELLDHYPETSARVIGWIGLGRIDPNQVAAFAKALVEWNARSRDDNAFIAGIAREADREEEWRQWLETTPPESIGVRVGRMVENKPYSPAPRILKAILRGEQDVAERRAAGVLFSERNLSRTARLQAAHELFLRAFPRYDDLKIFLALHLDVRLEPIASPHRSLSRTMFELLQWAESRGMMRRFIEAAIAERPQREEFKELLTMFEDAS